MNTASRHPADAALVAYAASRRLTAEAVEIEDHVNRCRRCRERLIGDEQVIHGVCAELRRTRWFRRSTSDESDTEEYVYRCGRGYWVSRRVVAQVQVIEAATHGEAVRRADEAVMVLG